MLKRICRAWDFLIAMGAAVMMCRWLSDTVAKNVTTELIAFFSIQAAVILPAMIFTAGILRPDGLSLPEARRYGKALRDQMTFWIVLLGLDFLTVLCLIFGKAVDWTAKIPAIRDFGPTDVSGLLIGVTTFFGTLAMLRTITFAKGVLSLCELNRTLTENAIKMRDSKELEKLKKDAETEPFRTPPGYGKVVERH